MQTVADKRDLQGLQQPSAGKLLATGTAISLLLFGLSSEDGPVLCPFRRCTGGYCPGCGLTRSGGRLVRGDISGSWQQHPYLVVGLIQAVIGAVLFQVGSPTIKQWLRSRTSTVVSINIVAILAVWIGRLADGSIPVPFGS